MLFAFYPDLDNIGSSANPWIDRDGIRRAVRHTGPTFHAGVEINELSLPVLQFKNWMGADFSAQAAADTFILVQNETWYVVEIS